MTTITTKKNTFSTFSHFTGLKHIIFVPFVVLQELDSLKQRRGEQNFTVKFNAKRAIRYIYELSTTDNKRLQGDYFSTDKRLKFN